MKRTCRKRRWLIAPLAAVLCAQRLPDISSTAWAQQAPAVPSNYGAGPSMPGAGMNGYGGQPGMGANSYNPAYNGYIPASPSAPSAPTRPSSWPGSSPADNPPPTRPVRRVAPLTPNGQSQNIYNQVPVSAYPQTGANGYSAPAVQRYPAAPSGYSQLLAPANPVPGSPASGAAGPPQANPATYGNPTAYGNPVSPYPTTSPSGGQDPSAAPPGAGPGPTSLVNFPPRRQTAPSPFSVPSAQLEPTNGVLHFTGTEVIALVGNDPILSGDVLPMIDEGLEARAQAMGKDLKEVPRDEIDAARLVAMKQQLVRAIETKMLFAEARRKIPKDNLPKVQEHANKIFDENEVKRLMAGYKVKSRGELDAKLHEHGASLDAARNAFFESGVGNQFLHQSVKEESEITHDQMLAYYREHIKAYETPPRARWEQILIKCNDFGSKEEAYHKLAQCGNQVFHGASFAQVAKAHSEDPSAADGGLHDWTTQGSLKYKPLDEAIFGLPVGRLSPIIEDERGFSIVRVVQRIELAREPFSEAQVEIKKKIKKERTSGQMERYVEQLRAKTYVWTIFDAAPNANTTMASGPTASAQC